MALDLKASERDQKAANRIARILRSLKWERRRVGSRAAREWRYFPAVSQYEGPCPSSSGPYWDTEKPEKSAPYPSVPVCPSSSETFSGETTEKANGVAAAGLSTNGQGKGADQVGRTGTLGHGPENKGENRVPDGAWPTGTPGHGAVDWDTAEDFSPWLNGGGGGEPGGERCGYCGDGALACAPLHRYGDPRTGGSVMHQACRQSWLRDRRDDAEERAAVQEHDGDGVLF